MEDKISRYDQNWRAHAIRITKYNPIYRYEEGAYMRDEWTSISDVGRSFDGSILSMAEYESVETAYINAIKLFAQYADTQTFRIFEVTGRKRISSEEANQLEKENLLEYFKKMREEKIYKISDLDFLVKISLREHMNISLMLDLYSCSRVYFGYDYYMYFVSDAELLPLKESISKLGLFMD